MQDPTSYYGVLFLLILPYLLLLYRRTPKSNFAAFRNWFVPLSTSIGLIFMEDPGPNEWGSLAFFSMMGLHYSIGQRPLFNGQKAVRNGYRRIGQLGTLAFLFMMSFEFHWDSYWTGTIQLLGYDRAIAVCAVPLLLAPTILFALRWRRHSIQTLDPLEGVFLLYPILFLSASIDPMIPYIASNLLVLALGIHRMIEGIREQRLATVNLGALILTILILLRFFEVDISFLAKGLSFLGLGALFFILNHRILQKRRAHGG